MEVGTLMTYQSHVMDYSSPDEDIVLECGSEGAEATHAHDIMTATLMTS
jgi:hypothetical protein